MAKPNSKAPLGEGGRFAALKQKLGHREGVSNPGALAAYIGRKKYGKAKFQKMAAHGSEAFSQSEIKEGFKVLCSAEQLYAMDEAKTDMKETLAERRLPGHLKRSQSTKGSY